MCLSTGRNEAIAEVAIPRPRGVSPASAPAASAGSRASGGVHRYLDHVELRPSVSETTDLSAFRARVQSLPRELQMRVIAEDLAGAYESHERGVAAGVPTSGRWLLPRSTSPETTRADVRRGLDAMPHARVYDGLPYEGGIFARPHPDPSRRRRVPDAFVSVRAPHAGERHGDAAVSDVSSVVEVALPQDAERLRPRHVNLAVDLGHAIAEAVPGEGLRVQPAIRASAVRPTAGWAIDDLGHHAGECYARRTPQGVPTVVFLYNPSGALA